MEITPIVKQVFRIEMDLSEFKVLSKLLKGVTTGQLLHTLEFRNVEIITIEKMTKNVLDMGNFLTEE